MRPLQYCKGMPLHKVQLRLPLEGLETPFPITSGSVLAYSTASITPEDEDGGTRGRPEACPVPAWFLFWVSYATGTVGRATEKNEHHQKGVGNRESGRGSDKKNSRRRIK